MDLCIAKNPDIIPDLIDRAFNYDLEALNTLLTECGWALFRFRSGYYYQGPQFLLKQLVYDLIYKGSLSDFINTELITPKVNISCSQKILLDLLVSDYNQWIWSLPTEGGGSIIIRAEIQTMDYTVDAVSINYQQPWIGDLHEAFKAYLHLIKQTIIFKGINFNIDCLYRIIRRVTDRRGKIGLMISQFKENDEYLIGNCLPHQLMDWIMGKINLNKIPGNKNLISINISDQDKARIFFWLSNLSPKDTISVNGEEINLLITSFDILE